MPLRKCRHGHDRFACGACAEDSNHGSRASSDKSWYQTRSQKITAWRKAKAARSARFERRMSILHGNAKNARPPQTK